MPKKSGNIRLRILRGLRELRERVEAIEERMPNKKRAKRRRDEDEDEPRFVTYLAAAMLVGCAIGVGLWCWLAITLAFFDVIE